MKTNLATTFNFELSYYERTLVGVHGYEEKVVINGDSIHRFYSKWDIL